MRRRRDRDVANPYEADSYNHLLRQIVISTGVVTTLAGSGVGGKNNGPGTEATFKQPVGITTDGIDIYVIENQIT